MSLVGWIVFSLATSSLVGAAAWLLERGIGGLRLPTRWIWLGALALSLSLPAVAAWRTLGEGLTRAAGSPEILARTSLDVELGPGEALDEATGPGAVGELLRRLPTALGTALGALATRVRVGPVGERWLLLGWAAASLLFATLLTVSTLRLGRAARRWRRERLLGRDVLVSTDVGPATVGLLAPAIVLPAEMLALAPEQLRLVLAHEEEHVRRKDPLLLLLGCLPVIACPWNPALWWQARRLKDAVEVDCDRRVIRAGAAASPYGHLLVRLGTRSPVDLAPIPTMLGSPSLLERRLLAMKKTSLRRAIPGALGAALAGLGLLVLACTTDTTAAIESVQPSVQEPAAIPIHLDGASVTVDGAPSSMGEVAAALRSHPAYDDGRAVVAIVPEEGLSYSRMAALERQLQAAGISRVVFHAGPGASLAASRAIPLGNEQAVALVIPEQGQPVPVSGRNLLHLLVQLDGQVDARLAQSQETQRLRPAEVEELWRRAVATNPRLIAAVRVHPDADYAVMVSLLQALRRADAQRISIVESER